MITLAINWENVYKGKYLHSKNLLSEIFPTVCPQGVSRTEDEHGNNLMATQGLVINLVRTRDKSEFYLFLGKEAR